ncbi:MAG: group 1 truncated hemoglobin [Thermodesulfobacteriales bacterium]
MCSGTGGPQEYKGMSMRDTHRGMNISEAEFVAVLDDILEAMAKHGIGGREKAEVLAIAYSMKSEIVRV